jgi:hypothetical protein
VPDQGWSDRSIGRLLITDKPAVLALMSPLRALINIVAPLPNMTVEWSGLINGSWFAWQGLTTLLSAMIYAALLPLALNSGLDWKNRVQFRAVHIPFLFIILSVAVSTQAIHERYRIMVTPWLWGCIWLGYSTHSARVRSLYYSWSGLAALGGAFYLLVKSA